jgi:hypothetical protein
MDGRPVRELHLNTSAVHADDYLGLLALPSVPLVRLFARDKYGEDVSRIVSEITLRAPELEDLELHMSVDTEDEAAALEYSVALSGLGGVLGAFRKLTRLALISSCDLSETGEVVREWQRACPTLRAIEFSKTEMWQREEGRPEWQRCAATASPS